MTDQDSPTTPAPPSKRNAILLCIAALALDILLVVFALWFFSWRWHSSTDDAYVGGNVVAVTPLTSGTVVSIYGDTTQAVSEGQLLVQLDDSDARLQLDGAEAALAAAVREVRGLYAISRGNLPLIAQRRADLARAKAELASSDAALAQAEAEFKRREMLVKQNFISAENLQIAQTTRDAARAQHDAALSAVQDNRAAIAHSVDQDSVSMALVPLDKVWLDANFKETELRDVRIGQQVTITSDFYGDSVVFHGQVVGMAPGTGSAFALLPAQNATGNWVKIVQRLPARIALDSKELQEHPLRIGLSM